jgi:hypothetical protein
MSASNGGGYLIISGAFDVNHVDILIRNTKIIARKYENILLLESGAFNGLVFLDSKTESSMAHRRFSSKTRMRANDSVNGSNKSKINM